MALYKEVDYCTEEVRSVARPGVFGRHGNHGGVQQYVVKEKFEKVDQVPRVGGRGHGHGGSGHHFEERETKFEEEVNTGTCEFHERKENFLVRSE